MKLKQITVLIIMLTLFAISCSTKTTSNSRRISLDFGWKFYLNDIKNAQVSSYDDNEWEAIDLPHDWSIAGTIKEDNPSGRFGGFFPGGVGWYRKNIQWDDTWENKQITITFDGVYMNSDVWINGQHLGKRPNGYIGFTYNLTPHLTKGNNVVAVRVDNSKQPSGRWYTGCGVYRHVWLNIKSKMHTQSTYVTFSDIDSSSANMHVETEINNAFNSDKKIVVETKLINADNIQIGTASVEKNIKAKQSITTKQSLKVENPQLWSPDNPYLYTVETTITEGNKILDTFKTTTGIRSLKFDASTGFYLNSKNVKIKGVCLHHDAGAVGSAVPEDVLHRRLQLLKNMGCNAIRTSHNPFAPGFYNMCDSLGFLVLNEVFDGWEEPKAKFDYGIFFNDWWKTDLTDFIKRDRNHPSVFMWSMGNEVRGRKDSIEHLLINLTHSLDPTRPVTIGAGHNAEICDIAGFNGVGEYPGTLEEFHAKHPDSPVIGTEVPHSWQTRGVYRTKTWWRDRDFTAPWNPVLGQEPREGKYFPIPDLTEEEVFPGINLNYLSSYDNATARISAIDQWKRTSKFDFLMGEFRWTGFDYLGENIWPNRGWQCGVIDLAGFPKDHYYFYQSVWSENPMVHILPHWSHSGKEGVDIPVVVYSNCNEVELFLNGKSLGIKKDTANDLRLLWYIPYQPGTLKAIARNNGVEICRTQHVTAGKPFAVKLSSDCEKMIANKRSTAHITVEIVDEEGNFVPNANTLFTYDIKGPAKLLGIENGDMLDLSSNKAEVKKTFNGLSLMYIQSMLKSGEIEVLVKSEGLKSGSITIKTLQ